MKSSIYRQLFLCLILTWIESFRATPVCQSSLGMEDGSIADIQLSASSAHSGLSDALSGRLNSNKGYGAWCPNQGTGWYSERNGGPYHNQYFQVFLNKPMRISAVGTQGRSKDYGMEGVESFYVNYTLMASGLKPWTQYRDWMQTKAKEFEGNTNNLNVTKMSFFKPPIIADNFRLIPILYPVNQVCLRMELYGCQITQDLLSYTMNPGNTFETSYNLTDVVFDGVITPSKLISGLGFLTDGVLAPENFITHNGYGWIGWHSKETRSPFIELDFLKRRVFKTVTFHSNIRTRSGIQLFKAVKIEFFDENVNPHAHVTHYTKDVSSGYTWMNYNVTVDMCLNYAKSLKMRFTYSGEWMLISEVTVDSDSVIGNRLPTPECATEPPVFVISTVADENTTTNNLTLPGSLPDSSSGLDAGAIIGIACGVLLILILLVLFLCCWCYRRKRHHQKKPSFYHFIRWELKPYPSGYRTAVRVSRLGSEEEKNYTFRRQPAESGEDRLEGQVPGMYGAGPIYASIENPDEIGKAAGLSPTTSMSPTKGGKPKNKPPPLPLHSIQGPTDAHYALPDSPISNYHSPIDNSEMISHEALSPEHHTKTLQPSPLPPQPDVIPTPDVFYAEPDTPAPPKTKAGYCEPIDAVIPGDGVFPNPVYEEIYAEPYQGVSGTSLYANPTTDLKIKHDNFKEFPREKLIFREKIGDGQFGEVHLGEAEDLGEILDEEFSSNRKVLVAIKVLKPDVDKNIKSDFFKEVKIMAGIQHENVIRLLGVCKDDPMCMIVEYMVNGDLNQFLKERELAPGKGTNKEKVLTYQALIYMASQIAAGMKYIASLKFVHRDLATRNCLVGHSYTVKIADFGMSRHLYSKHYYRVQGRVILPIRWMAPECILQGKFTSESDVWAFAVTLWEILTLAAKYPYDELTDEQVIENIQRMFFRPNDPNLVYLERPSVCPSDVYDMMKSCWQKDPNKRPVFKALHDFLKKRVRLSEMAI